MHAHTAVLIKRLSELIKKLNDNIHKQKKKKKLSIKKMFQSIWFFSSHFLQLSFLFFFLLPLPNKSVATNNLYHHAAEIPHDKGLSGYLVNMISIVFIL